ncbi:MAG: FAD-dependent oxidoreductase [Hyphomicrobiaceae bacterium]
MPRADVVVIGAGIIGLSTGYRLAKAGARVIVLEKGRVAYEASSRATGFLSLRADTPGESPLAQAAERLWDGLDDELGYPTEWTQKGRLWVAASDRQWRDLQSDHKLYARSGIAFDLIDPARCRELVPALAPTVRGGIFTPRSGHANPQRASQAFAWAMRDRGGELRELTAVTGIRSHNGRVTGVDTTAGPIDAGAVVSCAGPQTTLIGRMVGVSIPVASVRLEAMITTPLPPLFEVAIVANGISVRQTRRGNIHINGGPHEWIGVDIDREPEKPNTPLLRNIARRAVELMPSLSHAQVLRSWAGIVEITPDQTTLIERLREPDGMIIATCSGHGFGMAPSMGVALAELALEGRTSMPVGSLGLERFGDLPADWRERRRWQPGQYNT